jgi:hypothetical protein
MNKINKKQNIKKEIDSSDVSSYDDKSDKSDNEDIENMTSDEISQRGKEKFFKTELMEKIIKYIKIDDTIKEKQKEIRDQVKCLKEQKNDMEGYIIKYLENINQEFVNIENTAKLTKTTSITKGAIKLDNMSTSLVDTIKKQNINLDTKKISELVDSFLETVDKNRPTKTKTYIKRTKSAANKSIRKIAKNNNDNNKDDIPKYNGKNKK